LSSGLKKRTRKAFGIRKKEKDNDSAGSPDRDGGPQRKTNGAPNGFYGDIDWDRYNSPEVDDEGYSIRPDEESEEGDILSTSEEEEDHRKKFKIKIKPLPADRVVVAPSVDELKASIGNIALSPSPLVMNWPVYVLSPCVNLMNISVNTASDWSVSDVSTEADSSIRKPSLADLDNIFGPEQTPPAIDDSGDTWVCFNEESPGRPPLSKDPACLLPTSPPPPEEPAPPLPASPPPPESLSPPLPTSSPSLENPAPPLPTSPPPKEDPTPPLPTSPSLTDEPATPPVPSGPSTPGDQNPPKITTSPPPATPKEIASPPASSPTLLDSPISVSPTSKTITPEEPATRPIPPPLVSSQDEQPKNTSWPKENGGEIVSSPKDASQGSQTTPPPPPPPTYRAVVSSPGPTSGAGGTNSGELKCHFPSLLFIVSQNRPFSPPVQSASPPPIAPLARAESTSSISSTNSLSAATTPTVKNDQPSLVWFDRGKFYLTFEGCSRGPSPLTMGAQDTLPVAAAFTETVNAFFKGADPSKCVVKIIGEMVLSFPAGITRHFANNPSPAVLTFSITNYSRLEHVLPNPQLLCCDTTTQAKANAKDFWVNMPNLISHLKKVAEQKPQATYYNVDMLKYQVSTQGLQSTPLNLAVSWRCEPTSTDLRIDYKYNGEAMSTSTALNNVQFLVPVDGGVSKLQAVLPPAAWNAEQQRILWKIPDISQKSENGGVGSLLARFQLTEGPSKPAPLAVQFTSEGSTLSGCDIELAGPGYRFSLIKKRFAAGKYLADN
uniref:SH3GL interacting endocytic adaptor 1a n=1 Tax=Mastacembelus armatus TaxID=205130 RepID=A0A3Q3LS69_9TELE